MKMMVISAAVLGFGLPVAAVAAEQNIEGVGTGGDYFRIDCPNGYMVGFQGRVGAWVDQLRIVCAPWLPNEREFGSSNAPEKKAGASGGGRLRSPAKCRDDSAIKAVEFRFTREDAGKGYLHSIPFECQAVVGGGPTRAFFGSTFERDECRPVLGGVGHLCAPLDYPQSCPDGELATGLHGNAGLFVDALGLICGPAPEVSVSVKKGSGRRSGPAEELKKGPIEAPSPVEETEVDEGPITAPAPEAPYQTKRRTGPFTQD
jgi:hypothetical protein